MLYLSGIVLVHAASDDYMFRIDRSALCGPVFETSFKKDGSYAKEY